MYRDNVLIESDPRRGSKRLVMGGEVSDARRMRILYELLVRASRTFAVGIELLPQPLRAEITVAYLLLRVSDYLEDSRELAPDEKIRLLEAWRQVLGGDIAPEALVLRLQEDGGADARRVRRPPQRHGLGRIGPAPARRTRDPRPPGARIHRGGWARWTKRGSVFETESDLDDYMPRGGRDAWATSSRNCSRCASPAWARTGIG